MFDSNAAVDRRPSVAAPELLGRIKECLHAQGFALFQSDGADPEAHTLQAVVNAMRAASEPTASGAMVWDVRPESAAPNGARSHTLSELPLHTDASFEAPPPRYVGMQVVTADRFGGGLSKLLDMRPLVERLSPTSRRVLTTECFRWSVPPEDRRGSEWLDAPLLSERGHLRYRRDLIVEEGLTAAQRAALRELESLVEWSGRVFEFGMRAGTVLIVDNWRVLHGRTQIRDSQHQLKRVRFDPNDNASF